MRHFVIVKKIASQRRAVAFGRCVLESDLVVYPGVIDERGDRWWEHDDVGVRSRGESDECSGDGGDV